METIITLALATRLKRRIFLGRQIADTCLDLLTAESGLKTINCDILDYHFIDYGLIITIQNNDNVPSRMISGTIRKLTSGPLRQQFPDLWTLPSLWTKDYFAQEGYPDSQMNLNIHSFYDGIKSR